MMRGTARNGEPEAETSTSLALPNYPSIRVLNVTQSGLASS